MKKLSSILLSTAILMFSIGTNAFAAIKSVTDINQKIDNINSINNSDFQSFVSKSELVGERMQNFQMLTMQYKNEAMLAQENLKSLIGHIEVISNSSDIPDSEKSMQLSKIYQDADTILYNLDSKTMQYLYSTSRILPTITYQRYLKKFKEFYGALNITDSGFMFK